MSIGSAPRGNDTNPDVDIAGQVAHTPVAPHGRHALVPAVVAEKLLDGILAGINLIRRTESCAVSFFARALAANALLLIGIGLSACNANGTDLNAALQAHLNANKPCFPLAHRIGLPKNRSLTPGRLDYDMEKLVPDYNLGGFLNGLKTLEKLQLIEVHATDKRREGNYLVPPWRVSISVAISERLAPFIQPDGRTVCSPLTVKKQISAGRRFERDGETFQTGRFRLNRPELSFPLSIGSVLLGGTPDPDASGPAIKVLFRIDGARVAVMKIERDSSPGALLQGPQGRRAQSPERPAPVAPAPLSQTERKAADRRLSGSFAGQIPTHNSIAAKANQDALVSAIISELHPKSDRMFRFQRETRDRSQRDRPIAVAVFLARDESVKFAIDLRAFRFHRSFTIKSTSRWDQNLAAKRVGDGIYIVEDPGPVVPRGSGPSGIFVYGGNSPPKNNLLYIPIKGDLLVRHRFFSAVIGKPVKGRDLPEGASPEAPGGGRYTAVFKQQVYGNGAMEIYGIRTAMRSKWGTERAARTRVSAKAIHLSTTGSRWSALFDPASGKRTLVFSQLRRQDTPAPEFFVHASGNLVKLSGIEVIRDTISRRSAEQRAMGETHYYLISWPASSAERIVVFREGKRVEAVAGLWPLRDQLAVLSEPLGHASEAASVEDVDLEALRRAARRNRWFVRCLRYYEFYRQLHVKTVGDTLRWRDCVRELAELGRN